jgi:hypothetical protein
MRWLSDSAALPLARAELRRTQCDAPNIGWRVACSTVLFGLEELSDQSGTSVRFTPPRGMAGRKHR